MSKAPKSKLATVVVKEAAGKRIRELCVTEHYRDSDECLIIVKFDDDTEVVLNLTARPRVGIHYAHWVDGVQEVLTEYPVRFLER